MDDSQSSDIFSENSVNLQNVPIINVESYDLLLNKIKATTLEDVSQKNDKLYERFHYLLNDCNNLAFQGFDLILSLLENSTVPIGRVCKYIEDSACILQILSNFIKNVIETTALKCCNMKTFPTSTGNIISLVFSHCKDSECIYGSYLNDVEIKLKELFRNCHELQLTYLMALGKHYLFDLSEQDEQQILLETLNINLKIGEGVQSLDVKTMAEQWKGYVVICDKYSNFLIDKNVYENCTKLLACTVQDNIRTALETTEDKIVVRSLKIANFSLKILLKITLIFKGPIPVNYQYVLDMLQNISLCNGNYYELTLNKSGLSNIFNTNVITPADALTEQLVNGERFIKMVLSTDVKDLKDQKLLGYMILMITIMKLLLKQTNAISGTKYKLIDRVLSILPKCHVCLNMGLKFTSMVDESKKRSRGLYEHLLIHTIALSAGLTRQEYNQLEKRLLDGIMGFDYYTAVFSSNVWVSLCRLNNTQLQVNTLQNLLKIYKKLATNGSFHTSPQQININYTIELFFKTLKYPEKILIYKNYRIQDNNGIWFALKIRNLPENIEIQAERLAIEKLIKVYEELSNDNKSYDLDDLVKYMKLTATCSFVECNSKLEDFIVRNWSKVCPECSNSVLQNHPSVFRYIESLTNLTESYVQHFEVNTNIYKILNVISNIMLKGNSDFILLMFKTFCKLLCQCEDDPCGLLISILKSLTDRTSIQDYIFNIITSYDDINNLVIPVLNKHPSLNKLRSHFVDYNTKFQDTISRQELETVSGYIFNHKCIDFNLNLKLDEVKKSSNFDLDVDSLFEDEPASKKPKFDINIDNLISSLEKNVSQLSQAKENVVGEHKMRIKNVWDDLRNIIS